MSDPKKFWKFMLVLGFTAMRLPLILLFLGICIVAPAPLSGLWFSLALGAMILSAATDLLDGLLARRLHVESRIGAYADPSVDKFFYLTAFPTLVYLAARQEPAWHAQVLLVLAILFLGRDQWVSFLRSTGALYDVDAKANWSGKARTLISFPVLCIIFYYLQAPRSWGFQFSARLVYCLEALGMGINLISIWVYTRHYAPCLKKEIRLGYESLDNQRPTTTARPGNHPPPPAEPG